MSQQDHQESDPPPGSTASSIPVVENAAQADAIVVTVRSLTTQAEAFSPEEASLHQSTASTLEWDLLLD